ncbi:MAG TPA: TraM recognition domain-containing protein [Candidatus Paceibacterota bacterium]|nr:TraM recognition domain-containing protein [Candidatus Paceibacterota bacterium]
MPNSDDHITYFAETDYRSKRTKFGIKAKDRMRHMYIIGKTGMGKSTLLENLAVQDIQNGEGLCFIDPHGGSADLLLSYVPEHRIKDVIYFAPFDQEFPISLNVMEDIGRDKRPLVASGLIGAFKKVWVDAWSPRMEYLLNNALLALLEYPGSTLLGVNRIFSDKNYRSLVVANVTDPSVKAFWTDEYAKYSDKFATEATAAIQNKVGQFAANPLIRNMVGQPLSTFDIRKVMDEKKIFIVNLSKGRIGEGNANLLGSMLITKIYLAAMSRAEAPAEVLAKLPPFYLYVDEFQSFANESFADILSEARKYKLSLTIAHQYIEQMSDEVRAAVFGNVGTMITFRVGSYDAEVLEKEFAPVFISEDLVNLGFAQIYLKLMINGIGSPPFSATTLDRPKLIGKNYVNEVIAASRAQFARPRKDVEDEIRKWHEPVPEQPRDPNAPPETKKYAPGTRPPFGPRPNYAPGGDGGRPSYGQDGRSQYGNENRPPRGEYSDRPREPRRDAPPMERERAYSAPVARAPEERPERPPREEIPPPARPFAEAFSRIESTGTDVEILPEQVPPPAPPEEDLSREDGVVHVPVVIDDDYIGPDRRHGERRHDEEPVVVSPPVRSAPRPSNPVQSERPGGTLKSLTKKDKGPSQEKLSDLRAALALAMKQPPQTGSAAPLSGRDAKERPAPSDRTKPSTPVQPEPSKQEPPKEVPESVLRKLIEE